MPALDDVTQRFIADTAQYVAALKEAADVAYEFAVANSVAARQLDALTEALTKAAIAAATLSGVETSAMNRLADAFSGATAQAVMLAAAQQLIGTTADKASGGGRNMFTWITTAMNFWNDWKNVIHWAVMGTLEILSTAVPAMVAFGAAAVAMYPTVVSLQDHFTNLMVAAGGLHGAIGSMAGPTQLLAANMQKVDLAVAPDVWMIFGSAIQIATQHTGAFAGIAQQASNVLGSFAAKIVSDLQGQAGTIIQDFFARGVSYMTQWGQVLGNFGKDFLLIMHEMPGVGSAFLVILNSIAKAIGYLVSIPGADWVIGLAAAFSALYRYVTFAAGAMVIMFRITGIQAAISFIGDFIAAVRVAATTDTIWGATLLVLSGELDALQASLLRLLGPLALFAAVLAPGLIVAGLDIFLAKVTYTASSVEQLISQLEKLPPTAINLAENINTLGLALQTMTQKQTQATQAVAISNTGEAEHARNVAAQTQNTNQLSSAITKEYNDLKSLSAGLQALGYNNQQTNQDMAVLSISIGIQDSKVQQLNQAWDQYMGMIVGGESSLANFATTVGNMLSVTATSGIGNLGRDTSTFTVSIQQFQQALAAGPFGSATGAAAWQNFSQMFTGSAQQIADWAQTAKTAGALTAGQFRMAILDTAEIMSQFTGNTGAAASAVLAYAQRADPSITSMDALNKATGGVDKATGDLNGTMATGAINMSNAEQIAKNLSAVFNTQLTNAIVAAALKASGFDTDVQNMMQAQMTGLPVAGKTWQQWQTMAQNAMNEALATAQKDTGGITKAWSTVPANVTTTYTVAGQVIGNVPAGTSMNNLQRLLNGQHGMTVGFQGGGMVGGPSGVDAVHAALTAGEAVLNARAVAAMGGPLGIHALNNQPSEAVLSSGLGGGGGGMELHNHIVVEMDGRQLTSAIRVTQLTYDRRNPSPNLSLNRPGRPG